MKTLWQDLRYTVRTLGRSPGFTVMVAGILAIGMGGSMMIFTMVNELYLRPFPVPEQERLVDLDERAPQWGLKSALVGYADFCEWRRQNRTFDCMTALLRRGWNLATADRAERIDGLRVTYDYFDVLHVQPVLGRRLVEEDDRPGAARVAVLGAHLWQRLYGEDPGVVGRSLRLDGEPYTIVGVLPASAVFPAKADLLVPLAEDPATSRGYYLAGIGRLKAGVSLAQAQADLERIHKGLIDTRPNNKITTPRVIPLRERYMGEYRNATLLVLLVAGVVLMLACCNITGMMLARGMARGRELVVRRALGASRYRIIRQVLTETLLLCILGALLGALLSRFGLDLLLRSLAGIVDPWMAFATDGRVLVFCIGVIGLATLLSGLVPALQAASGRGTESTLWATGTRTTTSRSARRSLNVLVAGEIALAMTLLVGAVLLLEAFWEICRVPPGFRVDGVLTYRISLPPEQYKDGNTRQALFESHLEQVRALPGVQTASFTNMAPGDGYNSTRFDVEGVKLAPGEVNPTVLIQTVMADYFETMGIELLAGRLFAAQDYRPNGERTVVINETFAKRLGSNRDVLDKRIAPQGSKDWMRVIGITRDIKYFGLDQAMGPALYLPCGPNPPHSMTALVHTAGDPLALVPVIRETLRSVDPSLSIHGVRTMRDRVHASLWFRRTYSWLVGVFAVVAMVMAVGGIYGITSYSVSQRTQEIGIRLAFGARAGDIVRHVLVQGARLVGIGLGVGLIGALALGQLMAGLLFGVSPTDPLVLAAGALVLSLIALLACYIPARRAARIDPMTALRCE